MFYTQQPNWPIVTEAQMRQLQYLQYQEACKVNYEVSLAMAKADIEVKKKALEAQLREDENERMAKMRADIHSAREMQRTEISVDLEGNVEIRREMFGTDRREHSKYRLSNCYMVDCLKVNRPILLASFVLSDKRQEELVIQITDLDDRFINRKFNRIGLHFGFSHEKETLVRRLLVDKLVRTAEIQYIPLRHGWYQENGCWNFCFPEDLCYEEVAQRA